MEIQTLSREAMYKALLNKDSNFEGIFFAAIKTTGIFCRPTCTARKPKPENVEYYQTTEEAIHNGYRACKVCSPLAMKGETPDYIQGLLQEVKDNPEIRLKDYDLRQRGIDPAKLRRWFKKHHGLTFQAYLRAIRINNAIGHIKQGEKLSYAAFDNGYESLSGFNESFKNHTGTSPSNIDSKTLITTTRIPTPLGPMVAGVTDEGLCLLEFADRRMLETQLKKLRKYLNATIIPGEHPILDKLADQLKEYFQGTRKEFDLPLVTPGTDFQQAVWKTLMTIPPGHTRSYQEQANILNKPKAVRAVANANGANRIAIIIPCHRVIGSDGHLTGYGGGIWRKKWLLEQERGGVKS